MRFPDLKVDSVCQVGDMLRLDASRSFVSKGETAITAVTIAPESSVSAISVFSSVQSDWYLDWVYASAGRQNITVQITNDGGTASKIYMVDVLSSAQDNLFSNDNDIASIQTDILDYLPPGRLNFNYAHRRAQEMILEDLDARGFTDVNGRRLDKWAVTDIEEVRAWSRYLTLALINEDNSNSIDDVHARWAERYRSDALRMSDRAVLRIDRNNDGKLSDGEGFSIGEILLVKR